MSKEEIEAILTAPGADPVLKGAKLYDKIVKENMREVLPMMIKDIMGIDVMLHEVLSESVQHTKEKVPDQLSRVTDRSGKTYVLHIEWQSTDDANMENRMLSYRVMLRRKYKLPVKQYVIFLAKPNAKMSYIIEEENLKFKYNLVVLRQYNYKLFLNSPLPEQKLMAIFGNFGKDAPEDVIKKILEGIAEEHTGDLSVSRYMQQLRALIQLRGLTNEFGIAMGTITKFKVEKDPFYQNGVKKGIEVGIKEGETKKSLEVVENLILKLGLSDKQAADIAEVSTSFVKKIREEMGAKR